jgi:hypothetical protein
MYPCHSPFFKPLITEVARGLAALWLEPSQKSLKSFSTVIPAIRHKRIKVGIQWSQYVLDAGSDPA